MQIKFIPLLLLSLIPALGLFQYYKSPINKVSACSMIVDPWFNIELTFDSTNLPNEIEIFPIKSDYGEFR